jgi:hypothetical protein
MDMDSRSSSKSPDLQQELLDTAKNWLAMDGLWFQAVEETYGMDTALAADRKVWEKFSVIEARRIMDRLNIPENGGLETLALALEHRMYSLLNDQEVQRQDPATLLLSVKTCRVQAARVRRKLPAFPCKSVGLVEYAVFARTIDPRIVTRCISCPPETLPGIRYCSWEFTLRKDTPG